MPKQKFYHVTSERNVQSILEEGILTGANAGQGERLPFVMAHVDLQQPRTGHAAFVEFELDADDPKIRRVNKAWIEYHGNVPQHALTALCNPPSTNEEVLERHRMIDVDSHSSFLEFQQLWQYQSIESLTD